MIHRTQTAPARQGLTQALKAWLLLALLFGSVSPAWAWAWSSASAAPSLGSAPASEGATMKTVHRIPQGSSHCDHALLTTAFSPDQVTTPSSVTSGNVIAGDSGHCCCCGDQKHANGCFDCHLVRLAWLPATLDWAQDAPRYRDFFSVIHRFQSADRQALLRPPIVSL